MALMSLSLLFSHELLTGFHVVVHGLTFHGLVEVDILAQELWSIDASELGLASNAHTASAAHTCAINHD